MPNQKKEGKATTGMTLEIPDSLYAEIRKESCMMSFHDLKVTVLSILTKYFEAKNDRQN